jgi:DHA1 family bicyclomycin/chloramphenicol resistance-like MFS transporter
VLFTGLSPLATDAYLSGLPALQRSLSTTATAAQLTLTAFLIGMGIGQLVSGSVSDGTGRRPVLLLSAAGFLATSGLCAVAPTAPALVALRFLEGVTGGGLVAAGRAMVGDTSEGVEAAKRYGTLTSITLLAPVLAPPVGSVVLAAGSWRGVFDALAVIGVVICCAALKTAESLPPHRRNGSSARAALSRVGDLSRDWSYTQHVTVQVLATMGFFLYIGGSSFVLETVYRISPGRYAAVFTVNALVMVLTSVLFRTRVSRVGAGRLRVLGLAIALGGASGLLVTATIGTATLPYLTIPWLLFSMVTGGMGLAIPASQVLAQDAGRRYGGTATALFGGLLFLAGAAVTPLTGLVGYRTLTPMAILMCAFFGFATLIVLSPRLTGRARRAWEFAGIVSGRRTIDPVNCR